MIRSALIALGMSAGAAGAQGMVATAPVVEACGGTRLVLTARGTDRADDVTATAEVVSARMAAFYSGPFDYVGVESEQIVVSIPAAMKAEAADLEVLLSDIAFGFHDVVARVDTGAEVALGEGEVVVPSRSEPRRTSYVVRGAPVLTNAQVAQAEPGFDANGSPAVYFSFDEEGTEVFGVYTTAHLGQPFAIVLNDEVLTAPIIRDPITGGQGILFGSFTADEARRLAAILDGGVLPFDLDVTFSGVMDGADPSADFCP